MRKTTELPIETALNLIEAHQFAARLGRPLDHLVTIHWAKADGAVDPRRRWARCQICSRRWFERQGIPLTAVWAHERNLSTKQHTHVLIHLPRGTVAAFERSLARWIGGDLQPKVIDVRPADVRAINYVVKDVDPLEYSDLGIPRTFAPRRSTRPIIGKRAGVSQNLGPAARARFTAQTSIAA